jgi:hypothetical protein
MLRAMFRTAFVAAAFCTLATAAETACGERGGPGYRGPDGKCVGWAALSRVCGNPPTLRCSSERAQAGADQAAEHGEKIRTLLDEAHERAKRRQ